MEAIHFWRLTPRAWRMESVDDRARMLAHFWIRSAREAWRNQGRLRAMDTKNKPDGKGGASSGKAALQEMRAIMGLRPPA